MNDPIIVFITTATITSAIWAYLIWKPKDNNITTDKNEEPKEVKLPLPARYFYCIQSREELPAWDPMLFAAELYRDAKVRADRYMGIEFPLEMTTGDRMTARRLYHLDNRNFTHISATLNQMVFLLNTLGKNYPDVLQFCNKIIYLRLEIDNEAKKREFICATNIFRQRYSRALKLARGGTLHSTEHISWSELKPYFDYTEDELLF